MEEIVKVSVICNAYNHEKYIRKTLESILMQKVNFKYEIIVHDDASTDRTACIIKEFEEKYPDIIRPIYQTTNQYSQKVNISKKYAFPLVRGKYIAACEGDDFWVDETKLQRQFNYMEKHSNCPLCVQAGWRVNRDGEKIGKLKPFLHSKNLSTGRVILLGGGAVPTCSYFYRTEHYLFQPSFYEYSSQEMRVGDYPRLIALSIKGKIHYDNKITCAYRVFTENSWTSRNMQDYDSYMSHLDKMETMYDILNEYTNNKYKLVTLYSMNKMRYQCYRKFGLIDEIKKNTLMKFMLYKDSFRKKLSSIVRKIIKRR